MKNLEESNILVDYGKINISQINALEKKRRIKLPNEYCRFIVNHNGASLYVDSFDFYDKVYKRNSSECIAFMKVEKIEKTVEILLNQSTNDEYCSDIFKFYKYFNNRLIPFGDTGGGDLICFDYRQCYDCSPPIVLWCHDSCEENWNRISFIANNFEEFVNMLHEPKD